MANKLRKQISTSKGIGKLDKGIKREEKKKKGKTPRRHHPSPGCARRVRQIDGPALSMGAACDGILDGAPWLLGHFNRHLGKYPLDLHHKVPCYTTIDTDTVAAPPRCVFWSGACLPTAYLASPCQPGAPVILDQTSINCTSTLKLNLCPRS